MSLLRRRHAEARAAGFYYGPGGQVLIPQSMYSGGSLKQALQNAASWACIDVISDPIGRTPIDAYRGRTISLPVTPAPNLLAHPSGVVLVDVWRYQLGFALATDGNAFGQITGWTGAAYPNTVEWLDPATVTERKVTKGVPHVTFADRSVHQLYPFGDVWHVPGRVVPPGSPFGLSPVEYAAVNVGMSLQAQDFSLNFFAGGGLPKAIVNSKTPLTAEQAAPIKENIRRALTKGSADVLVMGADLTWQQVQSNPGDSQFIDLMRFCCEQAARVWRVPPSMIYAAVSGQNVTYSSVSDADLNLLKHTLDGYYVRVENALTECLPRPQYVKVNRNAILRGDPMARADFYTKMIATRLMSPNEARALEEMPPITDGTGDDFYGPVAPGKAEPQVPGDAPAAVPTPTTKPAVPVASNGNGSSK